MRYRITQVKQKQDDEHFSNWIPLGADAQDILVEVSQEIDANGYTDLQTLIDTGELGGHISWTYI